MRRAVPLEWCPDPVVDAAIEQRERLGIRAVWLQLGVVDEAAAARGDGAVMYGEVHVDKAHADKATEWLARVDTLASLNGGLPSA